MVSTQQRLLSDMVLNFLKFIAKLFNFLENNTESYVI